MRAGDGKEVTTDDMEIVSALRAALADKVGKERFELWFGASTRLEVDDRALTIGVPSQFFLDWIRTNFRRQIESACFETLGRCPALKFRVDASLSDPREEKSRRGRDGGSAGRSGADRQTDSMEDARSASLADPSPRSGGESARAARSALATRRRFASLDTFVSGETNQLALTSAQMVARRPGQLTPLLIHGPTSVGKTHLLEGIWGLARKSHRRITAVYLSGEQFTTYFLEALRGSGLPSFRRKYRGVELLILDDLQFLAGKRATQIELLHTVDTLLRDGRQLVFAADRSPAELAELGPELTTRLESGMVCRIGRPDYATRLGIVSRMATRLGSNVPPDVCSYIASRLTEHARQLSGALNRLQATSEALGRPIALPMAEEALSEMIRQNTKVVRLPDIERAVCDTFGLEPARLQSAVKEKRVSHPRMLAMWLARKHTRAALSEIGQYFGRRSHSTVASAQKRVQSWMAGGKSLALAETTWNVDEAIREVERRLHAG